MDVELTSKMPMVWWVTLFDEVNQYMSLLTKNERKAKSQTLGKRTTVFRETKPDKKIHKNNSSKYAIKGKFTPILGS